MEFQVTAGVNSRKVARFVQRIEEWEAQHPSEIPSGKDGAQE
jgi:hypothetical protein